MKATRSSELRAMLAQHGIHPSKALGQNFLIDGNIARIIADAAGADARDTVLEIGPGAGALTHELLARAGRVIAVELDHRLAGWLRERYADEPRLDLVEGDALQIGLPDLLRRGCGILASNLPYATGTRMLVEAMHAPDPPKRIVITIQTEVADRVLAAPGDPAWGLLGLWASRLYSVERVRRVPGSCFWPPPDVESCVIRLERLPKPRVALKSVPRFIAATRHLMMHRRKQLRRALREWPHVRDQWPTSEAATQWLHALHLDPSARPETLTLEEWATLSNALPDAPGSREGKAAR